MTVEEISLQYKNLTEELIKALSKMEYTDDIRIVRQKMRKLQEICPHESEFFHIDKNNRVCPYCKKEINVGDDKND